MIELRDLTLGYGSRTLLRGGNAVFAGGEFAVLVGRNGAGKSTLLRTISGLTKPVKGEVFVDGDLVAALKPREVATKIAVVSTDQMPVRGLSVADMVALGRAPYTGWLGSLTAADRIETDRALSLTGMTDFAHKTLDTLSDGERARAMIARALAQNTSVILLDEPTAYLDLPARYEIFALLRDLAHRERKTIVCSTHDLQVALDFCDTLALLDGGNLTKGSVAAIRQKVEQTFFWH